MAVAPPPLHDPGEAALKAAVSAPAATAAQRRAAPLGRRLRDTLPRGRTLPAAAWTVRHRALLTLLWAHVALLPAFGIAQDAPVSHALLEGAIVAAPAFAGSLLDARRRLLASSVVALGLLSSSAIVVHFSGGLIEAHFHFFVMVVALTLYEEWLPFLIAAAYVGIHHGVLGVLAPEMVYNHADAQAHPWRWAFVHAGFVAAAGLSAVATWRLNEDVRDDTERALARAREAERALTASAADLERSNRDLEQFAYVASHDLVEPLRTVTGFLELVDQRATGLDERSREYLRYALGGTDQMQALVGDLLDYAQAGLGGREEEVDLGALVDDVRARLDAAIAARGAHVTAGPLPVVHGDAARLRQVLQNLVANAVKFARPGVPPRVHISATALDGGGWEVAVADNGVGIPPEQAEFVFTMFERLGAVAGARGSGIGLAICERVVERHGGRIWVEPAPGGGSVFRFTLPARAERRAGVSAAAARTGRRPSR
jgi:signal transduction histidine kinase